MTTLTNAKCFIWRFCSLPCIKHTGLHFSCITFVSWLISRIIKMIIQLFLDLTVWSIQNRNMNPLVWIWTGFQRLEINVYLFLIYKTRKVSYFTEKLCSHLQHFVRSMSIFAHLLLMEWLLCCQKLLRLSCWHPTDELRLHRVWTLSLFASRCL